MAFAPFHSCQIFASLCIQGASNLDAFVSGLDICLSSCAMMSDSSLHAHFPSNYHFND